MLCVRAARGGERVYWAQMGGEGEGEWGSGHKWPRARWGEFHARRGRGEGGREQLGGGYAGTTGLTARARDAEREKKAGAGAREAGLTGRAHGQREREAGARKAAAPTGRARCAERGGEGGARARDGPAGPKGRGGGWVGLLYLFSFILNCFSLFFYLFYLIQIQMGPKFKLDLLIIMRQTKVKSRVQHDATIHTPLGFNIIDYNYK